MTELRVRPRLAIDDLPLRWSPPDRRWLLAAACLGVAGDVLFRATPGAGLALWLVALLLAGAALAAGREPLDRGVLLLGVAAAATIVVRAAPGLQILAVGMVALSVGWSLLDRPWTSGLLARLAGQVAAGLCAAGLAPVAAIAGRRRGPEAGSSWSRRSAVAARGAAAAAPVLLVVGALFAAGDPVFARYADRVLTAWLEDALSHLALAAALAWIAGGVACAMASVRIEEVDLRPGPLGRFAAEALVALLLVDLLFALFLGVQARALFGGAAFVEATAGMTYAEYARAGFFQLVVASAIALPTVTVAGWIVAPGSRHRRTFVGLGCGLAAAIVLVLASAAHRMGLYVDAYGLTEARLYASAFMIWLAFAAVWLAWTIARGRTERFAAGALVAAWTVFLALAAVNPAGLAVRVNAARAESGTGPGFDVGYGTGELGIDAVPALVDAVERLPSPEACRVAVRLVDLRDRRLDDDPRSWTLSRWRAKAALREREPELSAAAAGCRGSSGPGPGPASRGGSRGAARRTGPTADVP